MKKFKMPPALIIVMSFLAVVAILTYFVPTSVVVTDDAGERVIHYNAAFDENGEIIENAGTDPVGIWDFFLAPLKGFTNASQVAVAIFISGGFLAILNAVGALDAGIGSLTRRFKGNTLIVLLMCVFALMGTVYGAWEELPAYAIVIIPLFVSAGYDVVTGMMVILIGAVVGNMASVVNPYSIGAAVAVIGNDELSLGSGILLRMVLFVVLLALGIFQVLRYANKVKKDPNSSCVAGNELPEIVTDIETGNTELTGRRKASLVVFAIMILICVIGYIPWSSIPMGDGTAYDYVNGLQFALNDSFLGDILGTETFVPFGDWYFDEFSCVWLIGAVVVALINKMPKEEFVSVFARGCADLIGVVLVLSTARGIAIFMGSSEEGMCITFIYWIQQMMSGVPMWAFVIVCVLAYMLIGIFLQTTSGVAGITMPIFGALAMALFSGTAAGALGGQIVLLSSFTLGINFISGHYPDATNMGICEMAKVPYNVFVKQWAKILIPILITAVIIISIAPYIGLV
ncbi:MAG: hypothetical protein ACLU5F_06790 [Anaerovoracaceae bacterium]